jgi:MYXO-CTERM domain-containing protein
MKKLVEISAILMVSASLSFAQTADRSADNNADRANGPTATQNAADGNRNHNWGWIGLLGLAGLGGLRGRRQYSADRDREATNIRRAA